MNANNCGNDTINLETTLNRTTEQSPSPLRKRGRGLG